MSEANKNEQLVIGYFPGEAAAKSVIDELKRWDKANETIKLGHLGYLVKDANGKIQTHTDRSTGKGIMIGAGLGVLAAVLPGIGLAGGLLVGGLMGGAIGALTKKGLGLSPEELQALNGHLDAGQAALVVMLDEDEAQDTIAELIKYGGTDVTAYNMSSAALPQAAKAVDQAASGATDAAGAAAGAAVGAAGAAAAAEPPPPISPVSRTAGS